MLAIDATVTIVTFVPLAAVVVFTHWKRARLPDLVGRARDATVAVTKTIGDLFAGVTTVKVFDAEEDALRRLTTLNAHRGEAEVRSRSSVAWIEAISEASIYGGKGLVLLIGARRHAGRPFLGWRLHPVLNLSGFGCSTCRADSAVF